jgi:hypothetical protein
MPWADKPDDDWYAYINIEASKYYGANAKYFNKTSRVNHGCNGKGVREYNVWEKERYNKLKTKYND